MIREVAAAKPSDPLNVVADDEATGTHIANFIDAVRTGAALHQPIAEGAKSVLLCHLGNIAQSTGRALRIDASGHILDDADAMKQWQREYAPGWMPVV
jgi:hypothetical protein